MNMNKKQTVGDLIVIACVIFICLIWSVFLHRSSDSSVACIYKNGEIIEEADLSVNREIDLDDTVIKIENGKICFLCADCPDKLCVKSGWLSRNGDAAACVPSKTVITVRSGKSKSVHAVTY